MTIIQLNVAVKASEAGSVSLAAKQLGLSQSNASNYLKSIEQELGFQIFERGRNGVKPTPKGKTFLQHAKQIIKENDAISLLSNDTYPFLLRVGSMNYGKAFDALIKTMKDLSDTSACHDIQYHNVSLENGLEMLKEHKLDVLVGFLRDNTVSVADWMCSNFGLTRQNVCVVPFTVRVSENHPVLKSSEYLSGQFTPSLMKDYPYIDYPSFNRDSKINNIDDNSYQFYSYKILADGKENRMKMVSLTDGFTLGPALDSDDAAKYKLVSIPIEELDGELCLFFRSGESTLKEIGRYIKVFTEMMQH